MAADAEGRCVVSAEQFSLVHVIQLFKELNEHTMDQKRLDRRVKGLVWRLRELADTAPEAVDILPGQRLVDLFGNHAVYTGPSAKQVKRYIIEEFDLVRVCEVPTIQEVWRTDTGTRIARILGYDGKEVPWLPPATRSRTS